MKTKNYYSQLTSTFKKIDFLLPICLILTVSQIISIFLIFCKKERIILVPPVISQPIWIDSYAVSPTYLEQMGVFLGNLILTNSSQSIAAQRDMILRYVHPSVYTHIRQYLINEESHLRKHQGSYHFHIRSIETDVKNNTITLEGDRETFIAGRRTDQAKETYHLIFKFSHGRYLLFSCEKEEQSA